MIYYDRREYEPIVFEMWKDYDMGQGYIIMPKVRFTYNMGTYDTRYIQGTGCLGRQKPWGD